jgi:hypothetical protein
VSLTPGAGVRLLTEAFFQSLQILKIPLVLLGAALLWALTLGGLLNLGGTWGLLSMLFPSRRRRVWSVVLLDAESALTVYEEPDRSSEVVFNFGPIMRGIVSTGKPVERDGTRWLPVETPHGNGWTDSAYLTAEVADETFAEDGRVRRIASDFVAGLAAGAPVAGLVAGRGIHVSLSASPVRLSRTGLDALLRSAERHVWRPGDGIYAGVTASFASAIGEPLVAAFQAPHHETKVDAPVLASALIPTEFRNFHFLSIGAPGALGSWMLYFEYERRRPYIVAISVDG